MAFSKKRGKHYRGRGSFSPTPLLAYSIAAITKPFYRSLGFQESRLVLEWEAIVGSHLARLAVPSKISTNSSGKGAVLTLFVSSAAAPEVMHYTPQLIDKINSYFGADSISRILLKHHSMGNALRVLRNESENAQKSTKGFTPHPKALSMELLLAQIEDEKLRGLLGSLGTAVLSQEKRAMDKSEGS